ncbi:MAG: AMP-binding protein [Nodosilinea sp.]
MVNQALSQELLQPEKATTFVDVLAWRARQTPQGIAYRFLAEGTPETAQTITYSELQQRAQAIAVLLQDLNCQSQPVLLLYPAGLDYIAAFFGCLYAGAIAVPAYPPRPNRSLDRIQAMVQDAGATVALTDQATLQKLERQLAETPQLRSLYCLSTDGLQSDLAQQWHPPAVKAETLALLQYTSGSTALPKGVMISHDNLLHNSDLISRCFGNTATSRGVSWLPPYHDMGLVGGILQPLYVGAEMTLMAPVSFLQRPVRWLEAISHYRATTSGGPNFAYDLCVRKATAEHIGALDLSSWTLAFTGAEPIHQSTLNQFAAAFAPSDFQPEAFYPCYGMAETTLIITGKVPGESLRSLQVKAADLQLNRVTVVDTPTDHVFPTAPPEDDGLRTIVGCGQPAVTGQVAIVNPETHCPCPEDAIGEIWVRQSRSIAQGYWQREAATQDAFAATLALTGEGPFLRTGDLGFLHGDELYVTGRLKDLIIIRGRNHYPQDIEATVEQAHPDLRQGAGAAFAITYGDAEHLAIVQELERSALRRVNAEEVFTAIRRAVAQHHDLQIGAIGLLKTNAMPKTSSGKIQRHLCRSGFLDGQLDLVHSWQADTASAVADTALDWAQPDVYGASNGAVATVEGRLMTLDRPLVLPSETQAKALTTPKAIEQWMVNWLSAALQVSVTSLDVRKPFADHGLDSLATVELAEALELALGVPLSPTLAYEYPTIEALSVYLAETKDQGASTDSTDDTPGQEDVEVTQLVRVLERLSDAEIQALMGTESIEWS